MKALFTSVVVAFALSAAAAPTPGPKTVLRVGNERWHVALWLGDLKPIQGVPGSPDRQAFTYRNDRGMTLSVIVENAHAPATLASCRDVFERRKQGKGGIVPVNELQAQRGDAATQEYDLKVESGGRAIVHHDIFSCRVRGTYFIDVHASKFGYQPADRAALMALVDGVAIVQ